MLEKYFLRPPQMADLDAVFDLILCCDRRDVGFEDSDKEDLLHDWQGIDLAQDAWLAFDASGALRGYAACLPWGEGICLVLHDEPGTEQSDLFQGLLLLAEKRAENILCGMQNEKKRSILTYVSESANYQNACLKNAGYVIKKYIFNMHRDLQGNLPEPQLPAGVSIRTMVQGQDEQAIHALIQAGFDWRERQPQPFEDWKKFMLRPELFDASLWFMAVRRNKIVGACLCFRYSTMGWVRQLAVNKTERGQGVGRALLEHAFRVFQTMGMPMVGLAVESANLHAVHFYQTAGMVKAVHLNEYVKEVNA